VTTFSQIPDGIEVIESETPTLKSELQPLLIVDKVTDFLDQHGLGNGPLAWKRIGDGQSNVTYLLQRGDARFVLRRGPRPPLPKSTHDMLREAKIQTLIQPHGVPVPNILAVCEDESLLGVPFYVMDYLDGEVITDELPPALRTVPEKNALGRKLVDTLLKLHSVDITEPNISELGRPDGYLERQVRRFGALWNLNSKRDIPEVAHIGKLLAEKLPISQKHALVHGDYRIGNLMFSKEAPLSVRAVLDWEMATLGDPLADLGYMVATYATPDSEPNIMELTTVTREAGFWAREDLVEYYAKQSGLDVSNLPWYAALALWKSAIFCEAIYTRWQAGERPDDDGFGPSLETGVPQLLGQAMQYLQEII
jgi:aminoglycoside phosphotransferase (APT) family kinase protein